MVPWGDKYRVVFEGSGPICLGFDAEISLARLRRPLPPLRMKWFDVLAEGEESHTPEQVRRLCVEAIGCGEMPRPGRAIARFAHGTPTSRRCPLIVGQLDDWVIVRNPQRDSEWLIRIPLRRE